MREAFDLARGSHVVMMASDLETDPNDVTHADRRGREESRRPSWPRRAGSQGGSFHGYSKVKLFCNWIFQRSFRVLYGTRLTDMTFAYRILPTRLVQSDPLGRAAASVPLRDAGQAACGWACRSSRFRRSGRPAPEGESQNSFFRNFVYFRTGLKTRFACSKRSNPAEPGSSAVESSMKKVIVTTTINPPTEAIEKFQA